MIEAAARGEAIGTYFAHRPTGPLDTIVHLNLLNPDMIRDVVARTKPTAIIHTAAAIPGAPPHTFDAVNHLGALAVAAQAAAHNIRLVHVSTDVVHDGTAAPYKDDATPHPLSDYGRSKAAGEHAVLTVCPAAAIVRTSLIYGLETIDTGTAGFAARLERGEPLRLFHDVIRQPVHAPDLAAALVLLALDHQDTSGTINVAGSQTLTREEFGRRMLQYWNIGGQDRIEPVAAAQISTEIPLDLRLSLDRARSLGLPLTGVDQILDR